MPCVWNLCEWRLCQRPFSSWSYRDARFCCGSCRTSWVNDIREHEPVVVRFMREFDVDAAGCWIWRPTARPNGYGRLWENGRSESAHRLSWRLFNGPIEDGLFVLHRCDVRACVTPDHLFLGTQLDNMRDRLAKGKYARGDEHHARRRKTSRNLLCGTVQG